MTLRRTLLQQPTLADASPSSGEVRAATSGVGVQLYMLRDAMKADAAATLARIGASGFSAVEWWGRWSQAPKALRALLDANGLRSPSTHIELSDLAPEMIERTLDAADVMGQRYLLVAWTPAELRKTRDDWKRIAATLNFAGERAGKRGMSAGYHNHDFEFVPLEGDVPLEILVRETAGANVCFEIDCYWAFITGTDPRALLAKHASRVRLLHIKDASAAPQYTMLDVGDGVIPWAPLLQDAFAAGVQQIYVEHDTPTDPWASAARSRAWLRTIGY